MNEIPRHDIIIIGGGPAGLTAATYASRARHDVLILEKLIVGGQVGVTALVENYPGFPEGVTGQELVDLMERQTRRFDAQIEYADVIAVTKSGEEFRIESNAGDFRAKSVIVATGTVPRHLQVPGESEFEGRGVSFCAVCDGALYRDKRLVVIGGGDSALDEGLYLTRFASQVTIIHRRRELRAERLLQERAESNPKIGFVWDSIITAVEGERKVERVALKNVQTGETSKLDTDGVFIYIGLEPRTGFLPPEVRRDEIGFVTADLVMRTSLPGLFVAGDVRSGSARQISCAVGDGAQAAITAGKYLEAL